MDYSMIDDPTKILKESLAGTTRIPDNHVKKKDEEQDDKANQDIVAGAQQIFEYENQLKKRGYDETLSQISGVLKEMSEEQAPKTRLPSEDVENLVSSVIAQRNVALNRSAVEQARSKSLLKLLELKEKDLLDKANKITELEEKVNTLEKQLEKDQKAGNRNE